MGTIDETEVLGFNQLAASIEVVFGDKRAYLVEQLDEAVKRATAHTAKWKCKSTMTITLEFNSEDDRLSIGASIEPKLVQPKTFPIAAYVDKFGRLVSDDPRQPSLPLEMVPTKREQ